MNKKTQVEQLYAKNAHITDRDKLVDIITKSVDVTEGTARTYLSLAIKNHNIAHGYKYAKRNIQNNTLKREQAKRVFNDNPHMSRKELVQTLMENFDMTKQSASTHCTMFSKNLIEHGVTNHKALESMRIKK